MPEADELLEEKIRDCAHFLWEKDGQPDGREKEHWERARAEIEGARATDAGEATGPKAAGPSTREPAAGEAEA